MNNESKQAKLQVLDRAIGQLNRKLKTATGQTRKYLLFALVDTHRTVARINNN
jgi:hypothetical protein